MYRWLHPLKVLVMGATMVVMVLLGIELFVSIISSGQVLSLGYKNPNITLYCKDWAYVLAAAIWIIGFSIATLGFVVNIANALRVNSTQVKRFDELKGLTKQEGKDLALWLNLRTYDQGYLKELWGDDHD